MEAEGRTALKGALAALVVVVIWATWLISTRYAGKGHLNPVDLSLLRYGVAAVALSPYLLRTGLWPRAVNKRALAIMVIGAGFPFFQIAAFGMRGTPASAAGTLMPGIMPLATALIGMAVFHERPDIMRKLGMVGIALGGLLLLIAGGATGTTWRSYLVLPFGATLWACYTHAFRRSGLGAFEAGALISFWSTVLALLCLPFTGTQFRTAPLSEIALQMVPQGILSGVLAMIFYGTAIRLLGATQAAAYTALTPIVAVFGGAALLGEPLHAVTILAALVTGLGVLLSTGLIGTATLTRLTRPRQPRG